MPDVQTGRYAFIQAGLPDGRYDEIEYEYSILSGGGSLRPAAGGFWYRPPDTLVNVDVTVRFKATLRGTGDNFAAGSRSVVVLEFEFTVDGSELPLADAPNMNLTNFGSISEKERATISATPVGGVYDDLGMEWEIASGAGRLVPLGWAIAPSLAIAEHADPITERQHGHFSVNSTGGEYDELDFDWEVALGRGHLVVDYDPATLARAPAITIDDDIASVSERDCAHFAVNGSGGLYDAVEFEWEIPSGGGQLLEGYNSCRAASAPAIVISDDIASVAEDDYVHFAVNGSGGLYDAVEFEWEIVSGGGQLVVGYVPAVPAKAPPLVISDVDTNRANSKITANGSMNEDGKAIVLVSPASGEYLYDEAEFEWEIPSGGGTLRAI